MTDIEKIQDKIEYLDKCAHELSTRNHTKVILAILRLMVSELEKEK